MANKIPLAYADVELQLSTAIGVGDTTFSVSSATDDDGNVLPAGKYCFTVDNGSSNKEYLLGQLNGTDVTSVVSVSRQGVETSGANSAHRVGSPAIVTNFATLQRVADILRGQETLDGASPVSYDTAPTLSDGKELATVQYVLDNITGGTVSFDQQIITGTAGETVADGDLVYFKTSDQEWYKTDADTAATVEGVQLGIAQGAGTDGAAISGGVQISGVYTTTGLTAGSLYYAGNTAGAISATAGTTTKTIGVALSTTKLLIITATPKDLKESINAALAGGGDFGTPSASNKFLTEEYIPQFQTTPQVVTFTSSGTWTKDAGLKYIVVEGVGGGGAGGGDGDGASGGGGGYFKKLILAADLGATETVTVGGGGNGGNLSGTGDTDGGNTSFGSHATGNGGGAGEASSGVGGGATGGDIGISGSGGIGGSSGTGGNYPLGGSSFLGSGDRSTGSGYGAGGAQGELGSNGFDGRPGIVIVTEYYS